MRIVRHRLVDGGPWPVAQRPSRNMGGPCSPDYLVMHYTAGGGAEESIAWLCSPQSKASAHVVIARDGAITQLVPFDRVAWHAGKSEWRGRSGLNACSIGIELDNAGRLERRGGRWQSWTGRSYGDDEVVEACHRNESRTCGWHNFPEAQLASALDLSSALMERYQFRDVLGHDDISPGRKADPGPAFPMESFRARLMGRLADEPDRFVTTASLNIRAGAGTQHPTLPQSPLPKGTEVDVLDARGTWRLVDVVGEIAGVNDVQGWVHAKFLVPAESPGPA